MNSQTKQYQVHNSYSKTCSCQQVATLLLFIIQFSWHIAYVIIAIFHLNNTLIFVFLAIHYLIMIWMAHDYIRITIYDPADLCLKHPKMVDYLPIERLKNCQYCQKIVQNTSYHCLKCQRCTDDLDHHCRYLNNCIGVQNYQLFIRLLCSYSLLCLSFMGQAILLMKILFQEHEQYQNLKYLGTLKQKWVVLAFTIYCFLLLIAVVSLLGFHLYISCCANMTTLDFIMQVSQQSQSKTQIQKKKNIDTKQGIKQIVNKQSKKKQKIEKKQFNMHKQNIYIEQQNIQNLNTNRPIL